MSNEHLKLDFKSTCKKLVSGPKLSIKEINEKRNLIIEKLNTIVYQEITIQNFDRLMKPRVLNSLVDMYDELFFDNNIKKILQENGCVLSVCFNNRCMSVAGKCFYKKHCKMMEIHLSTKVFKNALTKRKVKVRVNSGLECDSILSCMLITFEHEFIHALLGCFCYNFGMSNTYFKEFYGDEESKELFDGPTKPDNGHSNVFMTIVNKKFGHTKYIHNLLKHDDTTLVHDDRYEFFLKSFEEYVEWKKKLNKGDTVFFNSFNTVSSCIVDKKFKRKLVCKEKNGTKVWNVPYQFLVRPKAKTPTPPPKTKTPTPPKTKTPTPPPKAKTPTPPPKTKTPTPPKAKTPTPPPKKTKKKIKFIVKPSKKVSNKSNNSNNIPIKFLKSRKKPNNFKGPYENKYLKGLPKDYTKKYGRKRVIDIEEIKRRCVDLGNECGGITLKNNNYSARKGKILNNSPFGEKSWIKS